MKCPRCSDVMIPVAVENSTLYMVSPRAWACDRCHHLRGVVLTVLEYTEWSEIDLGEKPGKEVLQ